jgi:hypothetical protein
MCGSPATFTATRVKAQGAMAAGRLKSRHH